MRSLHAARMQQQIRTHSWDTTVVKKHVYSKIRKHAWEIGLFLHDNLQDTLQLVPIQGCDEHAELALLVKGHVPISAGGPRVGPDLNALCHVMQLSAQLVELLSADTIPLFL